MSSDFFSLNSSKTLVEYETWEIHWHLEGFSVGSRPSGVIPDSCDILLKQDGASCRCCDYPRGSVLWNTWECVGIFQGTCQSARIAYKTNHKLGKHFRAIAWHLKRAHPTRLLFFLLLPQQEQWNQGLERRTTKAKQGLLPFGTNFEIVGFSKLYQFPALSCF